MVELPDVSLRRLSRLRIQHFALVRAIGASQTMHEAAEHLNLTQSAASKMLRDVEDAFGVRLFERGRTGAHPTAGGKALIARTHRLLHDLDAARQEQEVIARDMSVLLRVGALPVAMVTVLPAVFDVCRRRWPRLLLQTREATGRQLVRDVVSGVVDCGLGRIQFDELTWNAESQLVQDPLRPEDIAVVAPASHPLAQVRRVSARALVEHDWVLPPAGTVTHTALTRALQELSLPLPPARLESDASFGTLLTYVNDFNLLALMPRSIAQREAAQGSVRILRVPLRLRMPPLALICLRSRAHEPDLKRFRAIVQGSAGRE